MHEDVVPLFDAGAKDQPRVARGRRDHQPGCVLETPSGRHGPQAGFFGADVCCECALARAEDARADGMFGRCISPRGGQHGAGEFDAGYPGEGRLVLVCAADLQQVEEIGRGGVDGD